MGPPYGPFSLQGSELTMGPNLEGGPYQGSIGSTLDWCEGRGRVYASGCFYRQGVVCMSVITRRAPLFGLPMCCFGCWAVTWP